MADAPLSSAETLKAGSNLLRGTIAEELLNDSTSFSKGANGLLKFHGTYQQDDRDLRKQLPEKSYSCMVRVGLPGGVISASQYLALDDLAASLGDSTLRITTRQDLQYHYILKRSLKQLLNGIGAQGLSTLAACGDVVRNTTADTTPLDSPLRPDLLSYANLLGRALKPKTRGYAEIWLDGEKAASLEADNEPLYGATYLPRKFKFAFTHEGENLIDVYSNDAAFVAHVDNGRILGFTVLAGGGMGMSNGVKATFPRMADPIGYIPADPDTVLAVATAIVTIHRDFGNRSNRKLARLKYVIAERGVAWFRQELETRLGWSLSEPRTLTWGRQEDYLGWHRQSPSTWFYGLRVVSGRIKTTLRAALREIVETTSCELRFTTQQNALLCGLDDNGRATVESILKKHAILDAAALPPILRHAMACVSLPTCPQAITESERVLPSVVESIQAELNAAGLPSVVIHVRMTGCPNGCARPYTAEIGIVGESVDRYTIYLKGSPRADRLAEAWKRLVPTTEIGATLRPLFDQFAATRHAEEAFGDWCARSVLGTA